MTDTELALASKPPVDHNEAACARHLARCMCLDFQNTTCNPSWRPEQCLSDPENQPCQWRNG